MLTRRDFLRLAALVPAAAALEACVPVYQRLAGALPALPWAPLEGADFTALNRLTFGAGVQERLRFAELGLQGFVEEQLDFAGLDDFALDLQLSSFHTLGMEANELEGISNQLFDGYDREKVPAELRQATLLRQLYSRRQLYEVMVDFWSDHFNIFIGKEPCFYLKTVDDREVIRRHALGNFRDLLWASAHSPAMLVYLDNQANVRGTPNENYARELMELHTLGVEGGYSQRDVMELARCLTGWSVKEHFWLGDFVFRPDRHEPGTKHVLGMEITEAGQAEAGQVLERLALHPAAARFLSTKLARRFLADEPPAEIVEKAARTFLATRGDIPSVLRVILLEGLPLARPKYKRPLHFITSALRMLNAETDAAALQEHLLRMGQMAFNLPTPDGYPDTGEAWQGSLMPRWQFAFALLRGEIRNTRHNLGALLAAQTTGGLESRADALASLLLGVPLEASARDGLLKTLRLAGAADDEALEVLAAGLIASPAFQWR